MAKNLYLELSSQNRVLWDDRDNSPGEKFADADLIGIPFRVVISDKTLLQQKVELKERASGKIELLSAKELKERLRSA